MSMSTCDHPQRGNAGTGTCGEDGEFRCVAIFSELIVVFEIVFYCFVLC